MWRGGPQFGGDRSSQIAKSPPVSIDAMRTVSTTPNTCILRPSPVPRAISCSARCIRLPRSKSAHEKRICAGAPQRLVWLAAHRREPGLLVARLAGRPEVVAAEHEARILDQALP